MKRNREVPCGICSKMLPTIIALKAHKVKSHSY
jgi:hypothetical protein